MNAAERKMFKRETDSKIAWKRKAIERHGMVRHLTRKLRDLERSRNLWKLKYMQSQKTGKNRTT